MNGFPLPFANLTQAAIDGQQAAERFLSDLTTQIPTGDDLHHLIDQHIEMHSTGVPTPQRQSSKYRRFANTCSVTACAVCPSGKRRTRQRATTSPRTHRQRNCGSAMQPCSARSRQDRRRYAWKRCRLPWRMNHCKGRTPAACRGYGGKFLTSHRFQDRHGAFILRMQCGKTDFLKGASCQRKSRPI